MYILNFSSKTFDTLDELIAYLKGMNVDVDRILDGRQDSVEFKIEGNRFSIILDACAHPGETSHRG